MVQILKPLKINFLFCNSDYLRPLLDPDIFSIPSSFLGVPVLWGHAGHAGAGHVHTLVHV